MPFDWNIAGYLGIIFGFLYKGPQIWTIYKKKSGRNLSISSFLLQNAAYVSFIIYLCSKDKIDYLILIYYCIALILNVIILGMKRYYKASPLRTPPPLFVPES